MWKAIFYESNNESKRMKDKIILLLFAFSILTADALAQKVVTEKKALEKGFTLPPVIARPKALWPWVNGNFSLSKITYEMEQAKLKGMGGFDIWDVGTTIDENGLVPDGLPFLSDVSLQELKHAVEEGERLGLEIGLVSSSSWNAQPEWWDAESGNSFPITAFSFSKDGITIPLHLAAQGAAFIVFQKPVSTQVLKKEKVNAQQLLYTSKGW
jgi:hypothetical protein